MVAFPDQQTDLHPHGVRILVVDDEPGVLASYCRILDGNPDGDEERLDDLLDIVGAERDQSERIARESFDLTTAIQGKIAVEHARQALEEERPYSVAFIDMRMPPGMDGLSTAKQLRELDQRIYIVFVTAFSDHTADELDRELQHDMLLMHKPFTTDEVFQAARNLGKSWMRDRQLEQSVSRAELESVQQANRAKDVFLAAMSHEFRTPLTTIIGNSELIAESGLGRDQQELLRAIETSSRGLLALVNDILDFSKIEAGKFSIDEHEYDLNQLINEMERIFASRAMSAGIGFQIDRDLTVTHLLIGDSRRIGQILINLLGNAVKFTDEGHIILRSWIDHPQQQLCFSVEDQGIGIDAEALERLFQPYEQAGPNISKRFGGTGLGLHISQTLAQLMGGVITVESEEGIGSTFTLTLPYCPSETLVSNLSEEPSSAFHGLFTGRVLVAEDTPELQMLERRILEGMGVDVVIARNGKLALDLALRHSFDLVLMDMQMPEMDGIEATRLLREVEYSGPVYALTANVTDSHRQQFEAAGCDGFLTKPIDRSALISVLQKHLQPVTQLDLLPDQQEQPPLSDELMEIFMQRSIELRAELLQALEQQQWEQVAALAHNIKGSGTSYGYPMWSEWAEEIGDAIDAHSIEQAVMLAQRLSEDIEQVSSHFFGEKGLK